jgi:hypothetical protein
MEWNKELEEIGENLFAEYEPDRDPLKEAYMAGVKAALSELLDEVEINMSVLSKLRFVIEATVLTEHGPLTVARQDWKTVIENSVWTSRGQEWERESLQTLKQCLEDGLEEVNRQIDKL